MYQKYSYRVILCGSVIQIYTYDQTMARIIQDAENACEPDPVGEGMESIIEEESISDDMIFSDKTGNTSAEESYKRLPQSVSRCKRNLRRLLWANICQYDEEDKFVTLTFADDENGNPPTRKKVFNEFKRFKKKFCRQYGYNFEHIMIVEKGEQETHRLHIHFIAFGLPYINKKNLEKMWGCGYVWISKVNTYEDVVKYLLKYVEKTLEDDYIPKGARFYSCSKGLKKPIEYLLDDEHMEEFLQEHELGRCKCNLQGYNDFIGRYWFNEYINMEKLQMKQQFQEDRQFTITI